jgi:predicted naringenin-chalcone synthase
VTDGAARRVLSARVQQAFLPKFENEGQDAAVADKVAAATSEHFMVVTIKHSGSLVTLSGDMVRRAAGRRCWGYW